MNPTSEPSADPQSNSRWSPGSIHSLILVLLLAAGAWIRFFDLSDPPLDFHPTRQLHSLIIARGLYYQDAPGISESQRQAAIQQAKAEGQVEPQIFEWIVAQTYRLTGESPSRWPGFIPSCSG